MDSSKTKANTHTSRNRYLLYCWRTNSVHRTSQIQVLHIIVEQVYCNKEHPNEQLSFDFIAGQETDITEFDEALVKKLIEKITVFADHFTVEFKSGITIDIEA